MKIVRLILPLILMLTVGVMTVSVSVQDHHSGVMKRSAHVMGFDQTTTTHHFRLSRTGGIIEITANDANDKAAISQIQTHLRHIATMFSEGNFTAPMLIHAQEPPGVADMKRAGAAIGYKYEPLAHGGRVVLNTTSHVNAVHEFLRFQIADHRTGDPLDVPPQ